MATKHQQDATSPLFELDSDPILVLNPTVDIVKQCLQALTSMTTPPTVHMLGSKTTFKTATAPYYFGGRATDLIQNDTLELSLETVDANQNMFLGTTDTRIIADLPDASQITYTPTVDAEIKSTYNKFRTLISDCESYTPRAPSWTTITATLGEQFTDELQTDFEHAYLADAANSGDTNQGRILTLVGAANEVQLYNLSQWAEYHDFLSSATISRAKNRLEDEGKITTESIQMEMGRPRQRLILTPSGQDEFAALLETTSH